MKMTGGTPMTDITVAIPKLARWLERMGAPAPTTPGTAAAAPAEEKSAEGAA